MQCALCTYDVKLLLLLLFICWNNLTLALYSPFAQFSAFSSLSDNTVLVNCWTDSFVMRRRRRLVCRLCSMHCPAAWFQWRRLPSSVQQRSRAAHRPSPAINKSLRVLCLRRLDARPPGNASRQLEILPGRPIKRLVISFNCSPQHASRDTTN